MDIALKVLEGGGDEILDVFFLDLFFLDLFFGVAGFLHGVDGFEHQPEGDGIVSLLTGRWPQFIRRGSFPRWRYSPVPPWARR